MTPVSHILVLSLLSLLLTVECEDVAGVNPMACSMLQLFYESTTNQSHWDISGEVVKHQ